MVWNITETETHPLLLKLRRQYFEAFRNGLFLAMKLNEKKRTISPDGMAMKAPVFHSGYTMSNATEYSANRKTQFGHTSPFLITSYMDLLSHECKRSYAKAVAMSNAIFELLEQCPQLGYGHFC